MSPPDADSIRGWGHTRADTLDKLDRRDLLKGMRVVGDWPY